MVAVVGTPQAFTFTTSGTVVTYTGGGATGSSTWDVLCVNSDNVVTTPAGWTSNPSRVNSQGSYIFTRNGGTTTATLALGGGTASNSSALWIRVSSAGAVDTGAIATAGVDGTSGTSTPAITSGALSATGELLLAFAALHSIGSGAPTSYVWSSGYTAQVNAAQGGVSGTAVAGAVAVKVPAGTAAESPSVSWSSGTASDRYILVIAFTDAGGGTSISLADAGSAAEALTEAVFAALADAGAAADALTATVAVALADGASAADAVTAAVTVPLTDAGGAAESLGVAAAATLADAGAAGDTITTPARTIPLADAASAADSLAVSATVALTDTGSAADALDNGTGTNRPLADAGTSAETLAVTVTLPLADAGAGSDAAGVAALASLADTASGTDALANTARTVSLTDVASAAEALTLAAAIALADAGAAADTAVGQDVANVSRTLTDTGSAADRLYFVPSLITGRPTATGDRVRAVATGDPVAASVTGVY